MDGVLALFGVGAVVWLCRGRAMQALRAMGFARTEAGRRRSNGRSERTSSKRRPGTARRSETKSCSKRTPGSSRSATRPGSRGGGRAKHERLQSAEEGNSPASDSDSDSDDE